MKRFIRPLITTLLVTTPLSLLAHPGHMQDQGMHHMLHAEHMIILLGSAVVLLAVLFSRRN